MEIYHNGPSELKAMIIEARNWRCDIFVEREQFEACGDAILDESKVKILECISDYIKVDVEPDHPRSLLRVTSSFDLPFVTTIMLQKAEVDRQRCLDQSELLAGRIRETEQFLRKSLWGRLKAAWKGVL